MILCFSSKENDIDNNMRQQNRKGNFSKHTNNAYGYGNPNEYEHYKVEKPAPLLEWLMENVKGPSKTKVKQTLQGRGIKVNGKTITQFDYALKPGMKVSVSKTKKNQEVFKSRYLKIVYEDRYLIVVEKNIGILSMAAGHSTLNVKTVLDDYFHKTRQNCQAHVVHRLDRDTSGLMIYAKDKQTELALEDDWHHNVYDRRYVALVSVWFQRIPSIPYGFSLQQKIIHSAGHGNRKCCNRLFLPTRYLSLS